MLDRSAGLRGIVTGRGNNAGFTDGARAIHKRLSHRRSRSASRRQIAEQLEDMQESGSKHDGGCFCLSCHGQIIADLSQQKRQQRLARRRELYRLRKAGKQVADYLRLKKQLCRLENKLEPEARQQLRELGFVQGN